ncbi:MAG: LysR family transcriptional regulator [Pseudomonadales bacterium]
MNEKELLAFRSVAQTGSFTQAAAELNLTQPAVSKRIASLESQCNAKLLDRVGKQVFLTAAGRALLAETEKVLAALTDAQRAVANLSAEPVGTLALATSHHIGLHRLAPVLRALKEDCPHIRLDIRFEDSEDAADMVARGQVELAVVTLDPQGYQSLAATPIWHDPLTFMVAPDHPLAGRRQTTLAELTEHDAILPGAKTYTGRIVAALFADAELTLTPTLATNYLETIHMLVSTGLGWSMLPQTMAQGLHTLHCGTPVERSLGLVTNPARTATVAAQRFAQTLQGFADPDLTGQGALQSTL